MARLKHPRLSYFPSSTDLSASEVRSEYRRLRSAAQKRLKRLSGTEFARSDTYQYYSGAFPSSRGLSEADMRKALYDVAQFMSNESNTLRGMRRKKESAIKEMNSRFGEDLVNDTNYWDFIDFLQDKHIKDVAKGIDSDQIIELWRLTQKGVDRKDIVRDFDLFLEKTTEGWDPDDIAKVWSLNESGVSKKALRDYFNDLESNYDEVIDYIKEHPMSSRKRGYSAKDLRRFLK